MVGFVTKQNREQNVEQDDITRCQIDSVVGLVSLSPVFTVCSTWMTSLSSCPNAILSIKFDKVWFGDLEDTLDAGLVQMKPSVVSRAAPVEVLYFFVESHRRFSQNVSAPGLIIAL